MTKMASGELAEDFGSLLKKEWVDTGRFGE
jgi:hypothetical protein